MLSPKDYRKEFEVASLRKIWNERDRIVNFMHDFENDRIPEKYFELDTTPEEVYRTNVEYLKEICDLIEIKLHEKDLKTVKVAPVLAIEEVIAKFDEAKRKEFFEDLKVKDEELYNEYMKWKAEGQE